MREDWEVVSFKKSFKKVKKTKKILKRSYLDEGIFPIISQGDELINGYWNKAEDIFSVEKPVVIFGDHTKNIKFVDFDFVLGADGIKIFLPIDSIYSKFFYYQLLNIDLKDLGYARHYRLLKKKKIVVPPLPEQKRIVAILDEAFEAIDQAQANIARNIENAEELFQSKLNEIFSQKGEGWEEKKLKEVCNIRPSKREVKKILDEDELVSFVPMSHLQINQKYFEEKEFRTLKKAYKGYTYFRDGDVLLAKITPCFENGKLGIAKNLKNGIGFGSTEFIVYRPNEKLSNKFLYYFLNRDSFRLIGESMMGGAVGHQRIQKEFYEEFEISFPSVGKQEALVQEMDNINTVKSNIQSAYNEKIDFLEELKKSISQKAFAGELTQKQEAVAQARNGIKNIAAEPGEVYEA